jgi:hypothetical protein
MAQQVKPEPQSAADYDERTTAAVKSVLVEMGQILGSFKGKFAVVGGAVPWLLLENEDMAHVGTLDIDIALDAAALKGGNEYKALIESLMEHGYAQRTEFKKFQLVRQVDPKDGGPPIDVIVDFLMPRDVKLTKNKPALIDNFAVQRADGADLALRFYQMVAIDGSMPAGGRNRVEIAIASIPALLAMKGYAIQNRHKQKDGYDIYYCTAITQADRGRSPPIASRCLRCQRPNKAMPTSRGSSTRKMPTARLPCETLSRKPTSSKAAPPINGKRTLSDRCRPCPSTPLSFPTIRRGNATMRMKQTNGCASVGNYNCFLTCATD